VVETVRRRSVHWLPKSRRNTATRPTHRMKPLPKERIWRGLSSRRPKKHRINSRKPSRPLWPTSSPRRMRPARQYLAMRELRQQSLQFEYPRRGLSAVLRYNRSPCSSPRSIVTSSVRQLPKFRLEKGSSVMHLPDRLGVGWWVCGYANAFQPLPDLKAFSLSQLPSRSDCRAIGTLNSILDYQRRSHIRKDPYFVFVHG